MRSKLDVFKCCEVGNQIVELEDESYGGAAVFHQLRFAASSDILSVDEHAAVSSAVHAAQNVQSGGFPGSRGAKNYSEFALFDRKRRAVESPDLRCARPVPLNNVVEFDVRHVGPSLYCVRNGASGGFRNRA